MSSVVGDTGQQSANMSTDVGDTAQKLSNLNIEVSGSGEKSSNVVGVPFDQTCIMCPRRGRLCSGCNEARYCSKERITRSSVANHNLRVQSKTIASVFSSLRVYSNRDGDNLDKGARLFGADDLDSTKYRYNIIQGRNVNDNSEEGLIFIFRRPDTSKFPSVPPGATPNIAIQEFTRGGGHFNGHSDKDGIFHGAWLIMHYVERKRDGANRLADITMRDIRGAADMLSTMFLHRRTSISIDIRPLLGMMIHPHRAGSSPGAVQCSVDYMDFSKVVESSGIANLLGIPFLIRRVHSPTHSGPNHMAALLMRDVTSAMKTGLANNISRSKPLQDQQALIYGHFEKIIGKTSLNKGSQGFGTSPAAYEGDQVGCVVVCRADAKPLLPAHLEALSRYIITTVEPSLQEAVRGLAPNDEVPSRELVLNSITKENFLFYWERLKHLYMQMRAQGQTVSQDWQQDTPSPYDLEGEKLKAWRALEVLGWMDMSTETQRILNFEIIQLDSGRGVRQEMESLIGEEAV